MTLTRCPPLTVEDQGLRGRGARWRVRHGGGRVPRFDDLARRSVWDQLGPEDRDRALNVAALLHHRSGIDRELNGAALQALSFAVGEDLFDAVLDCDGLGEPVDAAVPTPSGLPAIGRRLLAQRDRGDPAADAVIERAARLVDRCP